MTTVLIADDHQIVLEGLEAILENEMDIQVVDRALDGIEVLEKLENMLVDVLILDLNMPRMNGLDTLSEVRKKHPSIRIIVLSMHTERDKIHAAIHAGAHGYILKNKGRSDLVAGIRKVMRGEKYYSDQVKDIVIAGLSAPPPKNVNEIILLISDREKEVLALLADGLTSEEIADKLCLAKSTIDTHKKNLQKKLDCKNEKLLVRFAVENQILTSPPTTPDK